MLLGVVHMISTDFISGKQLIKIFEDSVGDNTSILNLLNYIFKCRINITDNDIICFLNERFEEENPDLKGKLICTNIEERNVLINILLNSSSGKRYVYSSHSLMYFKSYFDILRKKCLALIALIEGIGNNNIDIYRKYIDNLDITIDKDGNILYSDALRLINPALYNLERLKNIYSKATNLETYLNFGLSNNNSLDDLLPSSSLQNDCKSLVDKDGYVPYTEKQIKVRKLNLIRQASMMPINK